MSAELTESEEKLVEEARKRILEHARCRQEEDLYDVLYAFILSESGNIYEGKPFESNQPGFNFCAERHAINQMQYEETEDVSIDTILVAGPVPDDNCSVTMPCGACRHTIHEFGSEDTSVISSNFVREGDREWNIFPDIQKYRISELYPHSYDPVEWD